jgi:hypothetical protein
VQAVSQGVEEGKQRVELDGMSPDELIKARTGYADIQDVRRSIADEINKSASPDNRGITGTQRAMRPMTADSNSLKREASP